jgi:hypothetical protein
VRPRPHNIFFVGTRSLHMVDSDIIIDFSALGGGEL